MKFSLIIDNYNYGRFLRAAIESALAQTYQDCEIIVVDDGSTDCSCAVLREYTGKVKAVCKENGGQASALNAGFRESTGEFVIFLDADDVLLPDTCEVLSRHLTNPKLARIQYPLDVIDSQGERLGRVVGKAVSPDATLGPFGVGSPTSGNAFSRKALLHVMPIPETEWRICADAYLTATTSLFGEVVSIEELLGQYRVHGTNSVAGSSGGIAEIRRAIIGDFNLHASLRALAPGRIGTRDEWLSRYPQHWVGRITSLRTSPVDHPWNDGLIDLVCKAVSATRRQPFWNLRRKLLYSIWIVAYGCAPQNLARALKRLESGSKAGVLAALLGRPSEIKELEALSGLN